MTTSEQQILDLRHGRALLHAPGNRQAPAIAPVSLQLSGSAEADWLQAVAEAMEGLPLADMPLCMWLPSPLFLFRTVRVPERGEQRRLRLIEMEVERLFPHDCKTLIWCHATLSLDALERQILIAAMHRKSFEFLVEQLRQRAVTVVSGLPSLFLAVQSCPPMDSSVDAQWLVSMEPRDLCMLCRWPSGALVRRLMLDPNGAPSSGDPRDGIEIARLGREFRRFAAELERRAEGMERIDLRWLGDVGPEVRAVLEGTALDAIGEHRVHNQAWLNPDFSESCGPTVPNETGPLLKLSEAISPSGRWRVRSRSAVVLGVCMAFAPLLWIAGNAQKLTELRSERLSLRQALESARMHDRTVTRLSEQLELEFAALEQRQWEHGQQKALLGLLADLQDAALAVGDTWFERLDWYLSQGGDRATLELSGKFLLRQAALDQKQQAIAYAEQKLRLLQERVIASPWVESMEQFRVSYRGIHQDLLVVPFEMQIRRTVLLTPGSSAMEENR